jgi:hypothetical protein
MNINKEAKSSTKLSKEVVYLLIGVHSNYVISFERDNINIRNP